VEILPAFAALILLILDIVLLAMPANVWHPGLVPLGEDPLSCFAALTLLFLDSFLLAIPADIWHPGLAALG